MRLPAIALALVAVATAARADETSTTDKLRILYSSRFTFTDDGLPLVTVQIVGGRDQITLAAPGVYGHGGVGSSYCWADPESGVSFAYLTNSRVPDPCAS